MRRTMCSIMTMVSSMISPTAAAMPPRVIRLKVWPQGAQHQGGDGQHRRHHHRGDGGDAPVAQEEEQHRHRQQHAQEHRVAHAGGRGRDQVALVVPVGHPDVRRQQAPRVGQGPLDVLGDLHRVAAGLLVDLEEHRRPAVGGDDGALGRGGAADRGHVLQADQPVLPGAQHDVRQLVQVGRARIGQHQVELVLVLQHARRRDHVGGREGGRHVRDRQSEPLQARRRGDHVDLLGRAAQPRPRWPRRPPSTAGGAACRWPGRRDRSPLRTGEVRL